jgi:tRNA-dihydrouridine synthase
MLGRGAMADPFIFLRLKHQNELLQHESVTVKPHFTAQNHVSSLQLHLEPHPSEWPYLLLILREFFLSTETQVNSKLAVARTKQWLRLVARHWPQADSAFSQLKIHHERAPFIEFFSQV